MVVVAAASDWWKEEAGATKKNSGGRPQLRWGRAGGHIPGAAGAALVATAGGPALKPRERSPAEAEDEATQSAKAPESDGSRRAVATTAD